MAREFALRKAAFESIQSGLPLSVHGARASLLGAAGPKWVLDLEARLAATRFDVRTDFKAGLEGEPAGGLATRISLLEDGDEARFVATLRAGLESPFSAARNAAIERLARSSAVDPERAKALLGLVGGAARGADIDRLADLGAAIGLDALLEFAATQPADSDHGDALSIVRSRFDRLVALPVSGRGLSRLRALVGNTEEGSAMVELFGMVRSVRRGEAVSVEAASIRRFAEATAGDSMGAALEAASEEARRAWGNKGQGGAAPNVGRRLIGAAIELDPSGTAPGPALSAGLRLLEPSEAIRFAYGLRGDAAKEALTIADETSRSLPPSALAPLLGDPEHPLFDDAVWIVGRRFVHGGEAALEPLIARLLGAEDSDVRLRAFGWLSTAAKDSAGQLRIAFDGADDGANDGANDTGGELTELQRLYLRELDRAQPHPEFRDVILSELLGPAPVDISAVDLAAALRNDNAVRDALIKRLGLEVLAMASAPTLSERLPHDGLASQLVRALGQEGLDAVEAALVGTKDLLFPAEAGEGARPRLPKAAIAALAASDPARVERYLGREQPRRVRVEAALQVAHLSEDRRLLGRAAAVLMEDFDGIDGSLQLASMRALCKLPVGVGPAELVDFAREVMGRRGTAAGLAAVDLMAARAAVPRLAAPIQEVIGGPGAFVADEAAFETALAAARRLAGLPSGSQVACGLIQDLDLRLFRGGMAGIRAQERGALRDLRGALLVGLAGELAAGRLTEDLHGLVLAWTLRAPMALAADDLEARFAGEKLLEPEFRWNAELECVRLLGARGMTGDVLGATPGWWCLDGRLMAALGAASLERAPAGGAPAGGAPAGGAPVDAAPALLLYRMALFAMEGERGADDTSLRLASARLGYVALLRRRASGGSADPAAPRLLAPGPLALGPFLQDSFVLGEIARVEADLAGDLRSGAIPAGVLGAAYGRARGIESMGVSAGDPGDISLVIARAGLRAAAAQHEYLRALASDMEADSPPGRSAAGAARTWERWRRLRVAGPR